MKKIGLITFVLAVFALIAQTLLAQTVYKGTDSKGNPVYSDHPFANSKAVEITPIQTYSAPPINSSTATNQPTAQAEQTPSYLVSITQPQDNQTFGHEIQNIDVSLLVEPTLNKSDTIVVMLNDKPYESTDMATISLKNLPRGSYKLQANVVSKADSSKIIAKSAPITFFQQRITKIRPNTN